MLRIMEQGFVDGDGQRYNPSMIRFGRGAGAGTRDVVLEVMVHHLLQEPLEKIKTRIQQLTSELQQAVHESRTARSKLRALARHAPASLPTGWEARVMEVGPDWCVWSSPRTRVCL